MDVFLDEFFNAEVMLKYLPDIIDGFWVTLWLAFLVVISGLTTGLGLALLRAYQNPFVNAGIILFVDLFRALPPLVIIIVGFFGLPFVGIRLSGFLISWLSLTCVLAAFT